MFGNKRFDELRFEYKTTRKITTAELEELYEELTEAYKELVDESETCQ